MAENVRVVSEGAAPISMKGPGVKSTSTPSITHISKPQKIYIIWPKGYIFPIVAAEIKYKTDDGQSDKTMYVPLPFKSWLPYHKPTSDQIKELVENSSVRKNTYSTQADSTQDIPVQPNSSLTDKIEKLPGTACYKEKIRETLSTFSRGDLNPVERVLKGCK